MNHDTASIQLIVNDKKLMFNNVRKTVNTSLCLSKIPIVLENRNLLKISSILIVNTYRIRKTSSKFLIVPIDEKGAKKNNMLKKKEIKKRKEKYPLKFCYTLHCGNKYSIYKADSGG